MSYSIIWDFMWDNPMVGDLFKCTRMWASSPLDTITTQSQAPINSFIFHSHYWTAKYPWRALLNISPCMNHFSACDMLMNSETKPEMERDRIKKINRKWNTTIKHKHTHTKYIQMNTIGFSFLFCIYSCVLLRIAFFFALVRNKKGKMKCFIAAFFAVRWQN